VLRFLHFYPSHQKALAAGTRVRVRGEARGGFFGLEMVHPAFKAVSAERRSPAR
jgi:ATP-dependent DNA helicase RecG